MEDVDEGKNFSFPKQEEEILKLWDNIQAFETQLKLTENMPEFIFYDGPPFAAGLPHYGHPLAGTIKDIVTRYQTMIGHHVTRRFGWDCHGLPVEFEIDHKLGITTRDQVLKMGIDKYNEECRSIVTRYVGEWEKTVTRMGRWIDFKNDYKTMDINFMESVWWRTGRWSCRAAEEGEGKKKMEVGERECFVFWWGPHFIHPYTMQTREGSLVSKLGM